MRHRSFGKNFGRTSAHRLAMRRNLVRSLFEHETISTTRQKAKYVRPMAEKLITLAKRGTLASRRRAIEILPDRDICKIEKGEPVKTNTVIRKLFNEIGPRFADRHGGYTRIIKLPLRRVGDNGELVLLKLVDEKVGARTRRRHTASRPIESVSVNPAASSSPAPAEAAADEPSVKE
jgi:large subunit ribosomal protein L17